MLFLWSLYVLLLHIKFFGFSFSERTPSRNLLRREELLIIKTTLMNYNFIIFCREYVQWIIPTYILSCCLERKLYKLNENEKIFFFNSWDKAEEMRQWSKWWIWINGVVHWDCNLHLKPNCLSHGHDFFLLIFYENNNQKHNTRGEGVGGGGYSLTHSKSFVM